MGIGPLIKKLRKEKKLTQSDLAFLVGVKTITIRKYESDERKPNIDMLTKLAKSLEVNISDLLGVDELINNIDLDIDKIKNISLSHKDINYNKLIDNLTNVGVKELINSTIEDILFLATNSTELNYNIQNFSAEEINELSNFVYNSYTLKINEILERHKNTNI